MAFELIRNKKALPATDAVVKVRRQHLFGSRAGTVTVSGGKPWEIRVVAPAWRMKSEELEETLIRSYREILRLAAEKGCASVALPLLSAGEPGFPRYWDYSVAFPILRDFAAEHEMQIYLIMDRMDPPDDGKLRADLDRFLHKCAREVLKEMRREAIFQQQKALERAQLEQQVWVEESQLDEEDIEDLADSPEEEEIPAFPEIPSLEDMEIEKLPILPDNSADFREAWDRDTLEIPEPPKLLEEEEEIPEAEDPETEELNRYIQLWAASFEKELMGAPEEPAQVQEEPNACFDEMPPAPAADICGGAAPCPPMGKPSAEGLTEFLKKTDASFSETLLKLIDAAGKKDSQVYTKANVSRQHFSKIRNNPAYRPTKQTAVSFAIALELDLEQTQDLIGRAGFVLTTSSKFDQIVMYFILNRHYDLTDINYALWEHDQQLLGA